MSASLTDLLHDFYTFLQHPTRPNLTERMSFRRFGHIVGLHYMLLIPVMIVMSILSGLIGLESLDHSIDDLMADSSLLWFGFMLIIAAPVLEELLFRFPLRYRRGSVFIAVSILSLLIYYAASYFLPSMKEVIPAENLATLDEIGADLHLSALLLAFLTFSVGMLIIFTLSLSKQLLDQSSHYIETLFPHIFFMTAMIFGFVHISNFSGDMHWYAVPVLVLPQFTMGLLLGYIRLRYGMLSNILLHAVNNFIPAVMLGVSQLAI